LSRQHIDILKEESRKVHPVEACALLFGRISSNEAHVSKIVLAKNKLKSNTRFEIEPEFVLKAFTEAEKEGLELIGMFHSHQAPTRPSLIDRRNMKLWGGTIWLILSSLKGEIAAYQMINCKVVKTPIIVDLDN
jgi:proteasome lid subunit RPN8/RPN11